MLSFHPIVFWGQTKEFVLLSVKVTNAKNICINIDDENVSFSAEGDGSNGFKTYCFDIKYYLPVITKDSSWNVKENFIEIKLKKEMKDPWLRLSYKALKLPWLKSDFNHFILDESDNGSDESDNDLRKIIDNKTSDILDNQEVDKSENYFTEIMRPLNLYLLVYNLFQFAGYLYVFGSCVYILFRHGLHENLFLFPLIRDQLITVQLASILEIFHAYLGWVKSSSKTTLIQVFGRNLVLFLIILPHKELQSDKELFTVLFAWSCIEIIRYPYYVLMMLHEQIAFITWLRYTIWIPLYPVGFMSEGKLILKSIPYLFSSRKFSVSLPNVYNIQFDFVTFLYIYIPITILGFYNLMMRMHSQRKSKFGPVLKNNWNKYSFLQFLVEFLRPKKVSSNSVGKNIPLKDASKLAINDIKDKKM